MSLRQHLLFETYGWDLGVFDHGIWQWSQFKFPFSSFHDIYWLGDHFHLILVLLAPLYWIWPKVEVLIISQAVLTSMGAVPLYYLAKRVTKHNLFSMVVVLGYLLYYSLQWHTFSGFHELAFLPLTLGLVFYFWETKQTKAYFLSLVLVLLVKEEIGLLIGAFGLWGYLTDRSRWKQALITVVLGLGVTLFLVGYLMPLIAGGAYRHSGFGQSGSSFFDVVLNVFRDPLILIKAFVDSKVKIDTMFTNFWPWGFLPLFAPSTLLVAFEQYTVRFLDYSKVIRWTPYYAYSLPLASITAWGSIYGFKNLLNLSKKYINNTIFFANFISILLFTLIILEQILLHAPINSLFKGSFYRSENWMADNQKVLTCVPNNASVSAQNSLVPWLSQRSKIKVFPEGLKEGYEYIVLDLHPGIDPNAFFFHGRQTTEFIARDLVDRGLYKEVCRQGDAFVLQKNVDTKGKLNYPFELEIFER